MKDNMPSDFCFNHHQNISIQRIQKIKELHSKFVKTHMLSDEEETYIGEAIVESWKNAFHYGVDPDDDEKCGLPVSEERYLDVMGQNADMIYIANNTFRKVTDIVVSEPCGVYLYTTDFILICSMENESWKKNSPWGYKFGAGSYGENATGTNSQTLAMRFRQPAQLVGPEHWKKYFHNVIASSAPIYNSRSEPIAVITMSRILLDQDLSEEDIRYFCNNDNNLVVLMSTAIEEGLKSLHKSTFNDRFDRNEFSFNSIIGKSKAIQQTVELAKCFAATDENVLLIGESGTGKELFANAIHQFYAGKGSFVAVNCAAIPRDLLESELFGYERGSFTGADRNGRAGKIEMANNGTLFLDEIGDMPLDMQAVLLRVLEDKRVMRVGGSEYIPVNYHLISATNKDLKKMVDEGKFREDLYYRLAILPIAIPPLRERGNDILLISERIIYDYCAEKHIAPKTMSDELQEAFLNYSWPGNVRQLKNALIYAINTAKGKEIQIENMPLDIRTSFQKTGREFKLSERSANNNESMEQMEKDLIERSLMENDYNVTLVAQKLKINKSTVYRKIKKYHIYMP